MIRALEPLGLMLAGIVAIWTALIPFDAADDGWPGPDLVLALTLAWVVRRPAGAPFWAVAALGMAADLALARPVHAVHVISRDPSLRATVALADGRELIDGMSSWWAAIHGYRHPHLDAALGRRTQEPEVQRERQRPREEEREERKAPDAKAGRDTEKTRGRRGRDDGGYER